MVSVGVIAGIVNALVLLTVTVVGRAIEVIAKNFAAARLHSRNRAPVVHDSDLFLPNLPRSLYKYRLYPAIFLTVVCGFFLILSELATEIGIDVSKKCGPTKKTGLVLSKGGNQTEMGVGQVAASCFLLQSLSFVEGNVSRVYAGLPKRITGNECFSSKCDDPKVNRGDIVRGCDVHVSRVYRPGELRVGARGVAGPFKTITVIGESFQEVREGGRTYSGLGGYTTKGVKMAIFVFTVELEATGYSMFYLEYAHQEHCASMKKRALENPGELLSEPTQSKVRLQRMRCNVNEIPSDRFLQAMLVYRTMQFENFFSPPLYDEEKGIFAALTDQDAYRVALSIKVAEPTNTSGTYYAYHTCGTYRVQYLVPLLSIIGLIAILWLISLRLAARLEGTEIPFNSQSWFRYSQNPDQALRNDEQSERSYFDPVFDEMQLVEVAGGRERRVRFFSRRGRPNAELQSNIKERDTSEASHKSLS